MTDPVEDALRQIHATREHRDQLQSELDRTHRALELQQAETDRLRMTVTQLASERDHYMVQCATLKNDLTNIQNIITQSIRKARDVGFGRLAPDPTALPLDDDEAMAQISYAPRRN